MTTDASVGSGSTDSTIPQWCEALAHKHAPDLLVVIDPGMTLRWTNEAVARVLGWEHGEMWGTAALDFVHEGDIEQAVGALNEAGRDDGYHVASRLRLRHLEGGFVDTRVTATTVDADDGTWMVLSVRPVEDEEAIERRRRRLHDLAGQFYVQCASMEWTDGEAGPSEVLGSLCKVLGCDSVELAELRSDGEELVTVGAWDGSGLGGVDRVGRTRPPPDTDGLSTAPCVIDRDGAGERVSVWVASPDGPGAVAIFRQPVGNDDWDDANTDLVVPMCASLLATVQRCSRQRAVAMAATTDPLTGLLNRSELHDRLDTLMRRHAHKASLAVFFADLNNFKLLNDTMGHQSGDKALVAVAESLSSVIREGDLAARVGGDEFVVAMEAGRQSLFALTERLRNSIEDAIRHWPEIGIAIGSIEVRPNDTPDEVLNRADAAMYEDKRENSDSTRSADTSAASGLSQLDQIVSSISIVVVIDENNRLIRATKAAAALFGFTEGSMRGADAQGLVHPDDKGSVLESVTRGMETGTEPEPVSVRVRDSDGGWHRVRISASNQLDNPEVKGVVLTLTEESPDYVPRGPADLAAGLNLALETLGAPVLVFDAQRWVVYASLAAEELLGYGPGCLIGLRDIDLVPTGDGAKLDAKHDRRRLGVIEEYEVEMLIGDDGEEATVRARAKASPLLDPDGNFLGTVIQLERA